MKKFAVYLNPEFQCSTTNGSGVIEKGNSSTFEVCHTLLSCNTANKIEILIYLMTFKSLDQIAYEIC